MMDETERSGSSRPDDEDRPPTPAAQAGPTARPVPGATSATASARPPATVDLADPQALVTPDDAAWIRDHAMRALALLSAGGEVRVLVVNDAEMADAHLRYADTPGTTDVLTFDLSEPDEHDGDSPAALDTDIMVCFDEAARRATEHGHETRRELLLYILHGVLHCLGHDDHDADAYERMHRAEDEILAELGVGATFHAAPASTTVAQGPAS